ncbi:MAG: diguanylate cyclase domain-containing protein, partial [Oscillospiraceae bacterium]
MSKELKNKTKRAIQYFCGILLFFIFQFGTFILDRSGLSQLSGICAAFQYASCLFLVRTNHKKGVITSIILLSVSAINLIRIITLNGATVAMSGLFNQIFYIVTILWFGSIFAKQEKAAVTDVLTGLLNRRGLQKELKNSIEDAKPFYLIDIELGNFKLLNDSFGNVYGDRLLKKTTERINTFIGDKGIVSRKNGSEFVIILKDTQNAEEDTNKLLDVIREKLSLAFDSDYLDCYVTAFAGIVSFPADSDNYEDLLKYADMAMVEALHSNSTTVCPFKPEMEKRIKRHAELEHLVKEGIEKDYFYLVYQPQYILQGKKLRGFETLIRMKLPDGTFVSPGEFIPVAEMSEQ